MTTSNFDKAEKVKVSEDLTAGIMHAGKNNASWGIALVDKTPIANGEVWLTWSEIRKLYEMGIQRKAITP